MADIRVVLVGGPQHFPDQERVRYVDSVADVIKYRFGAGFEHFRHDGEHTRVDHEEVPVFRWTARTAIAE